METTVITRSRGAYALSPVVLPSMAKPCPQTGLPTWRTDELGARHAVAAVQGGALAIRGMAFATDHFSTPLGPPSCSPPV